MSRATVPGSRQVALILLGVLVLALPAPAADADDIDRALEKAGRFLVESLSTIDRGPLVQQYPLGCRAMTAYAALEAGEKPNERVLRKLFGEMKTFLLTRVYSASLYVLALDARWRAEMAIYKPSRHQELLALEEDTRVEIERAVSWLLSARHTRAGLWSYQAGTTSRVDFSNTFFAILALQVAKRHRVAVDPAVLKDLRTRILAASVAAPKSSRLSVQGAGWWDQSPPLGVTREGTQLSLNAPPRTWPYEISLDENDVVDDRPSLSMTAATVVALMLFRDGLSSDDDKELERIDTAITGGIIALERDSPVLTARDRTLHLREELFAVFAFDLALEMAGITQLGRTSGPSTRADRLITRQARDGSWSRSIVYDAQFIRIDTAFAVLRLKNIGPALRGDDPRLDFVSLIPPAEEDHDRLVYLPKRLATVHWVHAVERLGADPTHARVALVKEILEALPARNTWRLLPALTGLGPGEKNEADTRIVREFAARAITRITGLGDDARRPAVETWLGDIPPWFRLDRKDRPAQIAVLTEILGSRTDADLLKRAAIDTLAELGTLDAAAPLLEALTDTSPEVRRAAYERFRDLTDTDISFRHDGDAAERSQDRSRLLVFWRENAPELRFRIEWRSLRKALEASRDPDERATLRTRIAALGKRTLPEIEVILSEVSYRFDWMVVWEMVTGEKRGI